MVKIELTQEQCSVVQKALELYSRIGIGQLDEVTNHPTFQKHLKEQFKDENGKTDYGRYHERMDSVRAALVHPRNMLIDDPTMPQNASWGIYHPSVDESCRVAFDIQQVVRHEWWKKDENRSNMTVDSSVHLSTKDSGKIKVEII